MALLGQESAQLREQVDQVRPGSEQSLLLLVVPLKRGRERVQRINSRVHKHGDLN